MVPRRPGASAGLARTSRPETLQRPNPRLNKCPCCAEPDRAFPCRQQADACDQGLAELGQAEPVRTILAPWRAGQDRGSSGHSGRCAGRGARIRQGRDRQDPAQRCICGLSGRSFPAVVRPYVAPSAGRGDLQVRPFAGQDRGRSIQARQSRQGAILPGAGRDRRGASPRIGR